jgi:hypothetical protein
MMSKRMPICVAWTSDDGGPRGEEQWCAISGKLDPDACNDNTLCGHNVVLRGGSARRWPTCPECRAKLGVDPPGEGAKWTRAEQH